jgi:hypothetical protein
MQIIIIKYDGTERNIKCKSFVFRTNQVDNWLKIYKEDGSKEIIYGIATIKV